MAGKVQMAPVQFLLAGLLVVAAAGPAFSQQATTMDGMQLSNDKPIQIESDQLEIHDKDSTAVFSGNVSVVQGTTAIKAGHIVVHYNKKGQSVSAGNADIDHIDMSEGVQLNSGKQQATGDTGAYEMANQTFVLAGKQVVLSEGENVFVGCKLTVQAKTGEAKLDACGGRVKIQLDPKSQKKQ